MTVRLVLALVLGLMLVVAPGAFDSAVGGTPLGASGRAAVCMLFLAWTFTRFFPPRRAPGWWLPGVLVVLVGLKVLVGTVSVPSGWHGDYRFGDQRGGTASAEFFWRFETHGFRIDGAVAFDSRNFSLHFLNDVDRFGDPPYSTTRRDVEFPLDVRWIGQVALDRPARIVVAASAAGELRVSAGGSSRTLQDPSDVEWGIDLAPGSHLVEARYRKPGGVAPRVRLELVDAATAAPIAITPWAAAHQRSTVAARVTDLVVLAGLVLLLFGVVAPFARAGADIERGSVVARAFGFAAATTVAIWTASLSIGTLGTTASFQSGNDSLLYASNARDILNHGVLMLRGKPLGQAASFFHYPFYPYALALTHAIVGDDVSTIYLLNGLALSMLPLLLWRLGWRSVTPFAAGVGFLSLVVFIGRYCWPILSASEAAYTDFVFFAIVFAALSAFARACATLGPRSLLAAGALLAIGAATRPSFLTMVGLAPVCVWVAADARPARTGGAATAWLLSGVFLGLLPFTLRNVVASGHFVVLVSSWIQIPYFLVPPEVVEKPQGHPGLIQALLMARNIVLGDPKGALWVETRKLLFTLGFTGFGPQGAAGKLFLLPGFFVASALLRRIPRVPLAVLVTFAVSHIAAMMLAAPWTSGPKSILPLHAAFLFGAVYLVDHARQCSPSV